MPKKIEYSTIKNSFESEGCTLLTESYSGNRQTLNYLDSDGEKFETKWITWARGSRPHNSKNKKPTIDEVRDSFIASVYVLLSTEYVNNQTKLDYICPKGHKHSMIWNSWKRGHRCPTCAIERARSRPKYHKYDFEDVKLSGIIYKVTNNTNSKVYIGQTVGDLHNRRIKHFSLANRKKPTNHFHKALKKYGEENFTWEILEHCFSKKELDDMEFHYIKQYDSFKNGYNMTLGGEGSIGRTHSMETRLKMSEARKGIPLSEEAKAKFSRIRKGRKKTKAHVDNVAASVSRYWEITYPNGDIITIRNLEEFCRNNDLTSSGMAHVAYGRRSHYKGFKCRKIGKTLEA